MKASVYKIGLVLAMGMAVGVPSASWGQETSSAAVHTIADTAAKARQLIASGSAFLVNSQQANGSFVPARAPAGMHALVLRALVQAENYGPQHPAVLLGFEHLLSFQLETGGIYVDSLASYNTAIAITALAAADDEKYLPAIKQALSYLKSLQWTDTIMGPRGERIDRSHPWFGGWGYGGLSRGSGRPDLSNAQFAIEALHASGLPADDPAFQNALLFVTRLQNVSETNDQPWAGNDGGFVYGPGDDARGESFAGEYAAPDGVRKLRSYGSMTHAGLKSMIYAGLSRDDQRVRAAWNWIRSNWTLHENPGMGLGNPDNAQYGLYYYFHTLSRALSVYGETIIVDPAGNKHDWRVQLVNRLAELQNPDGSWVGERRWMEDNPVLTTSYVVMSLQEALRTMNVE